ncbi:MAG TPA: hypothetical protein VE505_03050 [Vicinamibacterales bacterium]|nr:hypothetical protein [Vicinamibacterales bacterium]
MTIGPHQVLGRILSIPDAESPKHATTGVHQRIGGRARREVMNYHEPRVPGGDFGSLGPVPPFSRPTQKEMKMRTGEFFLEIGRAPITFDLGVREAISCPGADS